MSDETTIRELLTGTMSDYAIPKAHMVPVYELERTVTPSPTNPMGVKGAGAGYRQIINVINLVPGEVGSL